MIFFLILLDLIKKGGGNFYVALSNLSLKDVFYERGDIIPEVEYKKLENDHYKSKFVLTEVRISDKIPKKMTELGEPLSVESGWICRANVSTGDDVNFERGQVYSEEEMKLCPPEKRFKFVLAGRPNVKPDIPA